MTTPKRWIDEQSDADDFERAILRAGDAAPPEGAESDVLKRVMAIVAPVSPGGPGAPAPVPVATGGAVAGAGALAKSAATLGGLGKGFALGIGVSIAAATGNHFLERASSSPDPTRAPPAALSAPAARVALPPERPVGAPLEPRAEPEAPAQKPALDSPARLPVAVPTVASTSEHPTGAASVAAFPTDGAAVAASRLKEEAALLRRARAELRSGALAQAFATLEASRREFTASELTQEREALAIELLYRSGERAAAAARAREFLARFPESPHAAAVRSFDDGTRR